MIETVVVRPSLFRFSLRSFLIANLLIAFCLSSCVYIVVRRERSRHLTDPKRWPQPFQEIFKETPTISDSIKVYDLKAFLDEAKLVSVTGRRDIIHQLIGDFKLVPTDNKHLLAGKLLDSIPKGWREPRSSDVWYTSQGFGTVLQEGVDLFLIAADPDTGDAVILYNWIF
jgi:hypothetical protein